jgi:hypothetical protein
MNTLFRKDDFFVKERPCKLTNGQKETFYLEKAKEVISNGWSKSDPETIAEDLESICRLHDNGFEMAKQIENELGYYDIDVSFCEFLESLDFAYCEAVNENVKAWVKAHEIKPWFKKN